MAAPAEPTKKRASSLTLRIISAAVLIPIVVVAVYLGHPVWDLLVVLFGGVMIWEWCRIAARSRRESGASDTVVVFAIGFVVLELIGFAFGDELSDLIKPVNSAGFSVGEGILAIWLESVKGAGAVGVNSGAFTVRLVALPFFGRAAFWFPLGITYVLLPCLAIIGLRADPAVGLQQIAWIVALVIAADTGAYIAGRSIGGPKLAPRISPNKTWAGLGGAVVSAAIVGVIVAILMGRSIAPLALISAGLAIVEQAGDLAESAFKRHFGVKDASNIIPGHGGALDRVDGLIAVAAAVAGLNALIGSSVLTWL